MRTITVTQPVTTSLQILTSTEKGEWITPPSFTIAGVTSQYCGIYGFFEFSATASQEVTAELTSNQPINFYVMTDAQLQDWINTNRCPVTSALVRQENIQSYDLDWSSSQDGRYAFVFLNENSASANVSFSPQTIYSAETYYTIYSLTSSTITTSHEIPSPDKQLPVLVLICLTLGLLGLEVWRIRRPRPRRQQRKNAIPQATCPNCGFVTPETNDFCGKCGSSLADTTRVYE
jgi:hypothetical protein